MAKITAAGLSKNENAGNGLRIYVVSEGGELRAANRKDANRRCVTTVKSVRPVDGTREYHVTVGMGNFFVQGSQWFDLVEMDEPETVATPEIEPPPVVDTYASTVGEQNARLVERLAELDALVVQLRTENAELFRIITEARDSATEDEGFTVIADQVGILHAAQDGQEEVMCGDTIRTVTVVATGVRELHSGRKVCAKCGIKTRENGS